MVADEPIDPRVEEELEQDFALRVAAPLGPVAIDVRSVGVRYNLHYTKKTKLRTTFANLLNPNRDRGHFWALRDVSFTVKRGESVGVIGPNGSGKSTLLLVLAGIIQPSEGVVEVSGHVSTLLSLQAGFDPDLSGRENIALAGALMGIERKTMAEITPGVIKFADIGAFIDAPMKTYSSGMRARLGFSIATAVDPDILLLDEVLQTGDAKFKEKSRARITEVLRSAKAVVMVTHDLSWVTEFCTRAILLDKGRIVMEGHPEEVAAVHSQNADVRRKDRRKVKLRMKAGDLPTANLNTVQRRRETVEGVAVAGTNASDGEPEAAGNGHGNGHRPGPDAAALADQAATTEREGTREEEAARVP